MSIKSLTGGALLLTTLIIAAQNAGVVEVKFLGWQVSTSLALVIFGSFGAGQLGGWIVPSALRLKAKASSG